MKAIRLHARGGPSRERVRTPDCYFFRVLGAARLCTFIPRR
jgi:hypothetical protein